MIIGITGGVGAGKSTVIGYMRDRYECYGILADDVARDWQGKGEDVYNKIVDRFGVGILDESGEIDRNKLASIAFADESNVVSLNKIVHPAVRRKIEELIAENKESYKHIALEAALLVEARYEDIYDELWYIKTGDDLRIDRLKANRGYSEERCRNIMGNQLSDDEYKAAADYIIVNDGDINSLYAQIDKRLTK